ncbi:protein of unknown function [Pararobbsia alpina]
MDRTLYSFRATEPEPSFSAVRPPLPPRDFLTLPPVSQTLRKHDVSTPTHTRHAWHILLTTTRTATPPA